jgi:CRP-like cAMP-binding protein
MNDDRCASIAPPPLSPEAERWSAAITAAAAQIKLPGLFAPRGDAVYQLPNRHGVAVTGIQTHALRENELLDIMRYRLAQYLGVRFVDAERIAAQQITHEPLAHALPNDLHLVAGSPETGEIYCYAVVKRLAKIPPGATMRTGQRPLFPAEEEHGHGIFHRLRLLPDMLVERVCEGGRMMKNRQLPSSDERSMRSVIEVFYAFCRVLNGEWADEIDAFVGDGEDGVIIQNFAYFHFPLTILEGTVPCAAEDSWLFPRYQYRTVFPFACLTGDLRPTIERCVAINAALELAGPAALVELARLRESVTIPPSTLVPSGGVPALNAVRVLQQPDVAMRARLALVEAGERLRRADLFQGLSRAEATALRTMMEPLYFQAGDTILRKGDAADAIFIIESGRAEMRSIRADGAHAVLARRGPGDFFGESSVTTGETSVADIVATEPIAVLRLDRDRYLTYLAALPDVQMKVLARGVEPQLSLEPNADCIGPRAVAAQQAIAETAERLSMSGAETARS